MSELQSRLTAKVLELARGCGFPNAEIGYDTIIPTSGYLDSRAIIELIVWLETEFDLELDDSAITIDNFGTLAAIERYLNART